MCELFHYVIVFLTSSVSVRTIQKFSKDVREQGGVKFAISWNYLKVHVVVRRALKWPCRSVLSLIVFVFVLFFVLFNFLPPSPFYRFGAMFVVQWVLSLVCFHSLFSSRLLHFVCLPSSNWIHCTLRVFWFLPAHLVVLPQTYSHTSLKEIFHSGMIFNAKNIVFVIH